MVTFPIEESTASDTLLTAGFEHVALPRRDAVLSALRRLRREGLSGAEDPRSAVGNGPLSILRAAIFGEASSGATTSDSGPDAETSAIRLLQGWNALPLRGVALSLSLKCSGAIIRRGGLSITERVTERITSSQLGPQACNHITELVCQV